MLQYPETSDNQTSWVDESGNMGGEHGWGTWEVNVRCSDSNH